MSIIIYHQGFFRGVQGGQSAPPPENGLAPPEIVLDQ
jgi:hypothetical protein